MKKVILVVTTMLACVGCDQSTKYAASTYLQGNAPRSFIGDVFRLQYAENSGAMLSFGDSLPANIRFYIFTVGVGIILLAGMIYLILAPVDKTTALFGAFVISGGLGNLIDRILNSGVVVDFMNMGIGSVRTGIFNVADIAIFLGAAGLIFLQTRDKQPDARET